MRRKFWVIVVALPLLLIAGEFAYWRIVAEQLRTGYQGWLTAQAAQGWQISSGPLSISGWPRAAMVVVPNLTLHHNGPIVPGDVNVASAGVVLSISLVNPTNLSLSLMGPMHVQAGNLPDLIVTGQETSVFLPLRSDGPLSVGLHASGLRLEPASGNRHMKIGLLDAEAEIAEQSPGDGSAASQSDPAATFSVSAEAVALPAGIKWPLGPNISSVSADGKLNGPLPGTRDIRPWAEAWRDGGGSLEITHLAMGWGPLGLTSAATLALDEQLQPMGSGNGRIVGYADTLDRLAAAGMLTKSAATAAKAVLSLMAGMADGDQPLSVDVPLTLQYRTLSMRQVPLVRLPEVDWPAR